MELRIQNTLQKETSNTNFCDCSRNIPSNVIRVTENLFFFGDEKVLQKLEQGDFTDLDSFLVLDLESLLSFAD